MRAEPEEWVHSLGSAHLTEIWEMGYRDLSDLENPFQCVSRVLTYQMVHYIFLRPGDVKDFVKKIKLEDSRIEMRKKALARQAERIAAARAKAAAAASGTPTPNAQEATVEQAKSAASAAAAGGSLHPSLPAKPGSSSSAKAPESQAQPTPAPTPTPPTPAPAAPERVPTPAPPPAPVTVTTPADEQILKLEEVRAHAKLYNDRAI